jgi:hypothetical protein
MGALEGDEPFCRHGDSMNQLIKKSILSFLSPLIILAFVPYSAFANGPINGPIGGPINGSTGSGGLVEGALKASRPAKIVCQVEICQSSISTYICMVSKRIVFASIPSRIVHLTEKDFEIKSKTFEDGEKRHLLVDRSRSALAKFTVDLALSGLANENQNMFGWMVDSNIALMAKSGEYHLEQANLESGSFDVNSSAGSTFVAPQFKNDLNAAVNCEYQ